MKSTYSASAGSLLITFGKKKREFYLKKFIKRERM